MKQIKNKLSFKILGYLIFFSLIILVVLWFLQVVSFDSYYELSIRRNLRNVVNDVKENYKSENYLNRLSFDNNMCIEIYEGTMMSYSSISCYKEFSKLNKEKRDMILNNVDEREFKYTDRFEDSQTLMYGIKLENERFAFVEVRLDPTSSSVKILKEQLLIVSVFVCLLSIAIGIFISRKLSKPIEKINNEAKKLVKGEYDLVLDDKSAVTEIKELNETLKYTSLELSKTESLRREFMSNVSHDLKTPLTMIKAYAEMVRDLTYKDKKKMDANLNVIIEESDRLNLLVNDILDLSKYQSNTIELEYSEFDLNELIIEIINRYEIYKEKDGFKISYKKKKNCIVYADRKRIAQVIYNLLNNAINYCDDSKKINITIAELYDTYRVDVTNSGEGISKEDSSLIWDKYYKIDKTYSRVQVGTGIGLSIVKNILELHNVKYGVTSVIGKNTTFYFELNKKEDK